MNLQECIKYIIENTENESSNYYKLYKTLDYLKTCIDEFRLEESEYIAKLYLDGQYSDIEDLVSKGKLLQQGSTELSTLLGLFEIKASDIHEQQYLSISIVDNKVCPECHVSLENSKNSYKINNNIKKINTYQCPNCKRIFVAKNTLNSITMNRSLNDTNIVIDKDYTVIDWKENIFFHDVIVLKSLKACSINGHEIQDVNSYVNIVNDLGKIIKRKINVSYCAKCNKYYMLKNEFENIDGVVLCRVIDETRSLNSNFNNTFIMTATESKMHEYGYNVNVNSNLPSKQRKIILSSLIESDILSKNEILSHIQSLIARGNKIPNWKNAVEKWQDDYKYISKYDYGDLSEINIDKFILRYNSYG